MSPPRRRIDRTDFRVLWARVQGVSPARRQTYSAPANSIAEWLAPASQDTARVEFPRWASREPDFLPIACRRTRVQPLRGTPSPYSGFGIRSGSVHRATRGVVGSKAVIQGTMWPAER